MSQLLRKTREHGMVLPSVRVESTEDKFEVTPASPLLPRALSQAS
jgi:hypothetical protein